MNRREFFKFPAVLALMAVAPPLAKIAAAIPSVPSVEGFVREIMAYEINNDCYMVRWDISDGLHQHFIDYLITYQDVVELGKEDFLVLKRNEAISKLKEYALSHGMDLTNLVRMELPAFIEHARYV